MLSHLGSQAKNGWTLFEGLFIVASLVAVFATFFAISGISPNDPTAGAVPWLLGLNFLLLGVLAVIVVREYRRIRLTRDGSGNGRLAKRFVLLFGLSALMPAMIVAVFMGAFITQGLDRWIGERVDRLVEKNAEIFRSYVENFQTGFESDMRMAALDIESFSRQVDESLAAAGPAADDAAQDGIDLAAYASTAFFEGLRSELAIRDFLTIAILGSDGVEVVAEASVQSPILLPPPQTAFIEADEGSVATTLYEGRGLATAVSRIDAPLSGYLYAVKVFDRNAAQSLREAERALDEYYTAKRGSGRLQAIFAIGYAQIAGLILLLATRLGLEAAGRVTVPIARLASAATAVRDGDLGVRVPVHGPADEIHALSLSFNAMTEQLTSQQNALIQASREEADRRRFVETLLAEIGAGVMRVDRDRRITLANRSAAIILDMEEIPDGAHLSDIAPQFERFVRDTFERGAPVDASIDVMVNGDTKNVRLKSAPEPSGGCVLTFDDMTRLVYAQRQLAWRDVARRIAHEIRNPLTPIMLSTERLNRRYGSKIEPGDTVFERCIDTILRKIEDIDRMVQEFSSFARMPKPNVATFDLRLLLQGTCFAQSMVSPDIEIDLQTDMETATHLGDERLLGQAFGNLLKNAAEAIGAMVEAGESAGHIRIAMRRDPGGIEILIDDNGPGFPRDVRNRLLEPYVTTRERGTGLGLAIVNRIIADHGGSISLQNRPDGQRGARVRVYLPDNGVLAAIGEVDDALVSIPQQGVLPRPASL